MNARMTVRQAIVECLKRRGIYVGEDAMIASGEWGYWVGAQHYVSNSDISRILSEGVV